MFFGIITDTGLLGKCNDDGDNDEIPSPDLGLKTSNCQWALVSIGRSWGSLQLSYRTNECMENLSVHRDSF